MADSSTSLPLLRLVQPVGGLISGHTQLVSAPGEPQFPTAIALLNDVSQILPGVAKAVANGSKKPNLDGAGGGLEGEIRNVRAAAEALERYASCFYDDRQFLWATANELGPDALELDTIPRCSAAELSHPRCPLQLPDKNAPIRWMRGLSLLDGRLVWIPAVMVFLHMPLEPAERFWLPVSTGCAAHTSMERAIVSGICEVIERDAVSLTWLQQLGLPRIELDAIPERLRPYLERNRKSAGVVQYLFDATTDLGIPTVYSVQIARANEKLAALVMCSTELDPATAVEKVIRESASSRLAMHSNQDVPDSWDDFCGVSHGAAFMGKPERLPAYDFLLLSERRRRLSDMPYLSTGDARQDLAGLIERLRRRNMDAFAVDLTTDEALRVGMRVVRTIVPGLQPLSFSHRARFLGHPRLYDAPAAMGYAPHVEEDINRWPQPFA
ncbi:MAG TPA: YcaO-like family protein [Bryobacteraceae bacterium]|nr:YcaO-like family protein [Bryobacteraceae bacterium]